MCRSINRQNAEFLQNPGLFDYNYLILASFSFFKLQMSLIQQFSRRSFPKIVRILSHGKRFAASEAGPDDHGNYPDPNEHASELERKIEMLNDKYRRALADMENLRKQTQRQIEEAKLFAIQPFCKDLLEVADVLDLALNSLERAKTEDASAVDSSNMHKGIKMTQEVLLKTFKKHGLVPVRPEGRKFDPNMHEAVFQIPKEQSKHPSGHIAKVLNIGYSLHDRPIRPAKVGVVKMD